MAIQVRDILLNAQIVLNDLGAAKRWPLTELLGWVNEAASRICAAKPNANVEPRTLSLVPGAQQSIPAGTTHLVRVLSSLVPTRSAVTIVSRQLLDGFSLGWQDPATFPATDYVRHVILDPADPETFLVFPPNDGTGQIECEMAVTPTVIPTPSPADDIAAYVDPIPLGDQFQTAILDYVLYRAFSKDAGLPGAGNRALSHFQAFQVAIGEKIRQDMTMNASTSHAMPRT